MHEDYRLMLKREISVEEYVRRLKADVDARLDKQPLLRTDGSAVLPDPVRSGETGDTT